MTFQKRAKCVQLHTCKAFGKTLGDYPQTLAKSLASPLIPPYNPLLQNRVDV